MIRTRTVFGLSVALLVLLSPVTASADDSQALAAKTQRAIVSLEHRVSLQRAGNAYDTQWRTAGFIIEGGYVVTTARFVEGRRRVDFRLYGGLRARGTVVGVDPLNQIAVLKLQAVDRLKREFGGTLPTLSFGDSAHLRVGQTVAALGNSFDSLALDGAPSFSSGVITSFTRAQGRYRGVAVETDAAVNPGSFGGPLVTADGRVVGVIVPSFSPTRWLGQAVPGDQVKIAVRALIDEKKPAYGSLGVLLRSTGGEASRTGLEVVKVKEGSGASAGGIRSGDRLQAIEGVALYDTGDVARELKLLAPGSQVVLRVSSGGTSRNVKTILGRGQALSKEALATRPEPTVSRPAPRSRPPVERPAPTGPRAKTPKLGVRVQERDGDRLGLTVTEVEKGSLAQGAGIRVGDLLMAVGRKPLRSTDDLRGSLKNLRGSQLLVVVRRERRMLTVRIPLEALAARPKTTRPRPAQPAAQPGFLGVFLTPESETAGAPVDGTTPGSPAARAGLRKGDVVLAANGRRISNTRAFVALLRTQGAGESLRLLVANDGKRRSVVVTLAKRGAAAPSSGSGPGAGWLGAALDVNGGVVTVAEVAPNGPAANAGLRPGDQILRIGKTKLKTLDQLGEILAKHTAGQTLRLHVKRSGWTKTIVLTLAERP
jgi:serine protease Do